MPEYKTHDVYGVMVDSLIRDCFVEGLMAAMSEDLQGECPYESGSMDWLSWLAGYGFWIRVSDH